MILAVSLVRFKGDAINTSAPNFLAVSATATAWARPLSVSTGSSGPTPENLRLGVRTVSPWRIRCRTVGFSSDFKRSVK